VVDARAQGCPRTAAARRAWRTWPGCWRSSGPGTGSEWTPCVPATSRPRWTRTFSKLPRWVDGVRPFLWLYCEAKKTESLLPSRSRILSVPRLKNTLGALLLVSRRTWRMLSHAHTQTHGYLDEIPVRNRYILFSCLLYALRLTGHRSAHWYDQCQGRQRARAGTLLGTNAQTRPCPTHRPSAQGDRIVKAIPMRRLGDPAELDGLLLMLASDRASSYMTGSVLTLDGGIMLSNLWRISGPMQETLCQVVDIWSGIHVWYDHKKSYLKHKKRFLSTDRILRHAVQVTEYPIDIMMRKGTTTVRWKQTLSSVWHVLVTNWLTLLSRLTWPGGVERLKNVLAAGRAHDATAEMNQGWCASLAQVPQRKHCCCGDARLPTSQAPTLDSRAC